MGHINLEINGRSETKLISNDSALGEIACRAQFGNDCKFQDKSHLSREVGLIWLGIYPRRSPPR